MALDLLNQRLAPSPLEPRAVLASYDAATERITLRVSCQTPSGLRDSLCTEVLGIPPEKVRVQVGDVGGGFGMKTGLYPEEVVLAFGARALKMPLKWRAERIEEFLAATHGRDVTSTAELALDGDGRILALRVASLANLGAYATPAGAVIQLMIGPWVQTSVYDIPIIDVRIRGVLTHTAPTSAYRGAGRPEAIYIIERLIDAAARRIGIDQRDLRRRNMIRPEQMPYTNAMRKTYDSGQFEAVMDKAVALAQWEGFAARAAEAKRRGRLRGRGMATFLEWTGADVFEERVMVSVRGDGVVEIFNALQAMGQGLETTFAQLAVDVFGVPLEKIRIVQGDTDRGTGFGSAGSRSLFVGGSAVRVASQRTVARGQQLAAEALEAATTDIEYRDGVFSIAGTDRRIGLFELARRQASGTIVVDSTSAVAGESWPNACHICEVEVDPETGAVEVAAYWSVNDVGRVINPMIVIGQLEGGAVQGIGQALCERFVYDPASGQALSGELSRLRATARVDDPAFRDDHGRIDAVSQQPAGCEGGGRAGDDRRHAGGGQRRHRRPGASWRGRGGRGAADAADLTACVGGVANGWRDQAARRLTRDVRSAGRPALGHAATRDTAEGDSRCSADLGARPGACARSEASTQAAMRTSIDSPRLESTTGTLAPSVTPAASAPKMPVTARNSNAAASRPGAMRISAAPATFDSMPLARAAAAESALSTVSGPSTTPPVIRP